jgi:predicted nuclease of predicted toxin-antitoxin system
MEWALANDYVVFTHDIDFSTILALTFATGPSVLLVRTQDVMPSSIGSAVLETLNRYGKEIAQGALVVLDPRKSRVRLLPIKPLQ